MAHNLKAMSSQVFLENMDLPNQVITLSQPREWECTVKIAKNILKKSRHEDPYLALLAYCNTPQQGYDYSPVQRLMVRRLQDIYPIAPSNLFHRKHPQVWYNKTLWKGNRDQRIRTIRGCQCRSESSQKERKYT